MRSDGYTWSPSEPARQKVYRRLYLRTKERLDLMNDTMNYMLVRIERLEERLDELDKSKTA